MAKYEFSVRYAGDSLSDGRIAIKDLAPALLAISGAFQEIHHIKNPNEPNISVDIQATEKGSFVIDLILANGKDLLSKAVDLLSSKESSAGANLLAYVSAFTLAAGYIVKKIVKESKDESGQTTITFEDGTTITPDKDIVKIIKSSEFRLQAKEIVKPLENEGFDSIEISSEKTESIKIEKKDVKSFSVPKSNEEELPHTTSERYLQLLNVAFEHGKWRFSDGSAQFYASIEDEDFLESLKTESFNTDDRLKVRLRIEQTAVVGGLKSEYYIEKVLEHLKGGIQLNLGV